MKLSKRQSLQPILQMVATPIGNLSDITARARESLAAAQGIFCEDTRMTLKLLHALEIGPQKCSRIDAHAAEIDLERACDQIQEQGGSWVYVSDAGTPGVSDPGARLVEAALKRSIRVEPIPGPSSLAALISILGKEAKEASFFGFFPRKKGEQEELLTHVLNSPWSKWAIWFESGNRIEATLRALKSFDCSMVVAKELTKIHEKVWRGNASEILIEIDSQKKTDLSILNGEWTFAIWISATQINSEDYVKALQCLLNAGVAASEAARQVSQVFGVSKNEVYKRIILKGD